MKKIEFSSAAFLTGLVFVLAAMVVAIPNCAHADMPNIPYPNKGTPNPVVNTFTAVQSGDVIAYFAGSEAGNDEEIGLLVNGVPTGIVGLDNHSSSVGQSLDLGHVNAGDSLVFFMQCNTYGLDAYSDPSMNSAYDFDGSKGHNHLYCTSFTGEISAAIPVTNGLYFGFEDLRFPNSDFDYNDVTFVLPENIFNAVSNSWLTVTIAPDEAVSAGAVWSFDGGVTWQQSGDSIYIAPGEYTLEFTNVDGWLTPSNQTVTITAGNLTTAEGVYQPLGSLKVNITPSGAVDAGAMWSTNADSDVWFNSGYTVSNLVAGAYTVYFTNISGWITPSNQTITISNSTTVTTTGNYVQYGSLQVGILPPGAVAVGALWSVDGVHWQVSSNTIPLPPGQYTVRYTGLVGWNTPSNQTVTVSSGELTTTNGIYSLVAGSGTITGTLNVSLTPTAAVTAGAHWKMDSGSWQSSGVTVSNIPPGTHTVAFQAVPNWTSPASRSVSITAGKLTSTNASYLAVTNELLIRMTGLGTISPNYSNAWLQVGNSYSITSSPASGFKFTSWTISTNWIGGVSTNTVALHFVMAPNLTLLATFTDTNKPTVTITAPTANQRMTNALAYVKGTASDNWGLTGVWYQLNTNGWKLAATSNGYTNWTTTATLSAGTNMLKAYALDWGGNYSATSSVSFYSSNTFKLLLSFTTAKPLLTNGLTFTVQLSSNLNGHLEYSTNLLNWVSWTNFKGTNAAITFRDPAATNLPHRFYRAVVP